MTGMALRSYWNYSLMLKRIEVEQLRMGMYCSSWVSTESFVKKAFFISNRDELE